jgi:hypothetical protein
MFINAKSDNCPPRPERTQTFADYQAQRRLVMSAMQPTMEEYDLIHNSTGPLGWTNLDVQTRSHDEMTLGAVTTGPTPIPFADTLEDTIEAVAGGGGTSRTSVDLNSADQRDPFDDAISRTAHMHEPLRGDRRSLEWERAVQNKRQEIAAPYDVATQTAVDEAGLNMRTALASLTPLDQGDARVRPRSDREEHQMQTRRQFEASATSQLGRASYGNFGM